MLNFLHYWFVRDWVPLIVACIRLYAILVPIVSVWNFFMSYRELTEQKEMGSGLLVILFHTCISVLLILFSIWLAG